MAAGAKIGMKILTIGIGLPITIATRKLVEKAWLSVRPDDPPRKAAQEDTNWADAVTWGVLSAIGLVAADMAKRKGAEKAYKVLTGSEPPAKAGSSPKALKQADAQDELEDRAKKRRKKASSR